MGAKKLGGLAVGGEKNSSSGEGSSAQRNDDCVTVTRTDESAPGNVHSPTGLEKKLQSSKLCWTVFPAIKYSDGNYVSLCDIIQTTAASHGDKELARAARQYGRLSGTYRPAAIANKK